jgi:predicted transposase YbfD/YdcC
MLKKGAEMQRENSLVLMTIFKHIEDPRIDRNKLYPLDEIILVAFATILSGGETYVDMHDFGTSKLAILRELLPFSNGVPSEDTFERVFSILNPKQFVECFAEWVNYIREKNNENVISIDGKKLRRSGSKTQRPLHVINAWAHQNRLVIGCLPVDSKSNEITMLPEILKLLSLKKTTVTLDAMGCQLSVTHQIVDAGGDFAISLKGNQGSLHEDVKLFFEEEKTADNIETYRADTEKNHGRIEMRSYGLCTKIAWLKKRHPQWPIKAIGCATAIRIIGDKKTSETRYFILTLTDVQKFAHAVRAHWEIENALHGVLDITFHEDNSRVRDRNAATNLAIIRRVAVNILEKDKTPKRSKRRKRLIAGWDDSYLKSMLTTHF